MKNLLFAVSAVLFASASPAISAPSEAESDRETIVAAYDAIHKKKPAEAINEVEKIIKRFETSMVNDSVYRCTSAPADTLATLMGAAIMADKGENGKDTTTAVSNNICSAYFLKGFALIDLGKHEEALPSLKLAVEMDPDNQHYLNELGEWHKTKRNWQKSLEIFTRASETTDMSIALMDDKIQSSQISNSMLCRSYRGIAFNHVEMQNWNEARSAVKKCLELIPGEPRSQQELDYIASQSGKK